MPTYASQQFALEWRSLLDEFPSDTLDTVQRIAETHRTEMARFFYAHMLDNPTSSPFLTHDQVKTRLAASMERWILTVFSALSAEEIDAVIDLQKQVGEIHARIEVPVSLVLRGARQLKVSLALFIEQSSLSAEQSLACSRLSARLIDLAMELMSLAYSQSHDRNSRAEEAYRLFSVSHNLGAEKERQRGALLDWENQLMFALATGQGHDSLPLIATSEFGLWFRHKASHAFQGSPESTSILSYIEAIDAQLRDMTYLADQATTLGLLRKVREQTKSIKFLLDSLFEQANDLEAGRDALTRLLNRKFLPVVMSKEVLYSRQSGHTFAVLLLDVDYFKQINDNHGHDVGDQVLQHLAGLLTSNTRGGDYAFRHGGEEFLVLLVDINPTKAMQVAENLRHRIAAEPAKLSNQQSLNVTVSIGVAVHDGHPDYQRLLRRADEALYLAKSQGRNRCVLKES